jgi:ABC-type transport system involved in multi-copper enzyme maturation permease subunit
LNLKNNTFLALIVTTFREAVAKKIFLGFFLIATVIILIFLFVVNVDSIESMVDMMEATGPDAVKQLVINFEVLILNISYLLIITFCLIAVSSFIPSMVEKGNIDVLLSKPISRIKIILGKFAGGVALIFISLVYLLGFVWIILSSKSGFWHFPFLSSILWLTLSFAVIYSLIILIGLLTNSTILSILIGMLLTFILSPVLFAREQIIFPLTDSSVVKFIFNFLYYILPKPSDLNSISSAIITGEPVASWQPVITSVLFMLVMLSLSILYFRKKDY